VVSDVSRAIVSGVAVVGTIMLVYAVSRDMGWGPWCGGPSW